MEIHGYVLGFMYLLAMGVAETTELNNYKRWLHVVVHIEYVDNVYCSKTVKRLDDKSVKISKCQIF